MNFRSYQKAEFELSNKTVLAGNNGTGKTNILEAIYMLATGKSFRADTDGELIRYEESFANIQCSMFNVQLRIFIDGRKRYEVNGVPRRMVDFAGKLKAVLFGPADIEIITGSPSKRRKYLDFVLSQKDREYRRCLIAYEKGLRQRNRLLDLIKEGIANRTQLFFWDKLLIKNGNYLTDSREKYLDLFATPSVSPPSLGGEYKGGYRVFYDKSIISEARIKQYEKEEVAAGNTLVGPHRDDFIINIQSSMFNVQEFKDISKYGSRGQQRMAILALKIYELKYLTEEDLPVLLLDDVFSELDHKHRDKVLEIAEDHVKNGGQVIMTTADEHMIPLDWNVIRLHD